MTVGDDPLKRFAKLLRSVAGNDADFFAQIDEFAVVSIVPPAKRAELATLLFAQASRPNISQDFRSYLVSLLALVTPPLIDLGADELLDRWQEIYDNDRADIRRKTIIAMHGRKSRRATRLLELAATGEEDGVNKILAYEGLGWNAKGDPAREKRALTRFRGALRQSDPASQLGAMLGLMVIGSPAANEMLTKTARRETGDLFHQLAGF